MNDLDLIPDGGELAPYSQPDTPLVPQSDEWSAPAPDHLTESQPYTGSGSIQIFGTDLPPGTTMDQARQAVDQAAEVFRSDMVRHLGQDSALVDAAIHWYRSNCFQTHPDYPVRATHHYNLAGYKIPRSDRNAVTAFLNYMWQRAAPMRFIAAALYWLSEASKLSQQPQQQSASGLMGVTADQLSDTEFAFVSKRAPADQANCEAALRNHWGHQFAINLRLVKNYLAALPVEERDKLTQTVCKGGILSGNTPEMVLALYKTAIGANTMPQNGPAIAAEIAQIENLMRTNRKAYLADERLQARLRELYTARDGG